MIKNQPDCPVEFVQVNENVTRIAAAQVVILIALWFVTQWKVIPLILSADFYLRAVGQNKYSVLAVISNYVVKLFSIKNKPVDRGPKNFAALVGFIFTLSIFILHAFNQLSIARILAIILIIFALLESVFAFCAGCYVYTFFTKIKSKNNFDKQVPNI